MIESEPHQVESSVESSAERVQESSADQPLFDQGFALEPQIEELGDDLISISPEEVDALFEQDLR